MSDWHDQTYGPTIEPWQAFQLVVEHGVELVESLPAVDRIELRNGWTVRHWHGGYEHDCEWRLKKDYGADTAFYGEDVARDADRSMAETVRSHEPTHKSSSS